MKAGPDAGGYTWARFGFLPSDPESYEFAGETAGPVRQRLAFIKAALTGEESDRLARAAEFENDRDIWRIADARSDVAPALHALFNEQADLSSGFVGADAQKSLADIKMQLA